MVCKGVRPQASNRALEGSNKVRIFGFVIPRNYHSNCMGPMLLAENANSGKHTKPVKNPAAISTHPMTSKYPWSSPPGSTSLRFTAAAM